LLAFLLLWDGSLAARFAERDHADGPVRLLGWADARATAGASATLRFYAHAVWSPPLGWGPWIAIAAGGVLLLLGAAGQGARLALRR
jgi:hypothetical protein